jgi:hypothetical protein
MEKNLVYIDETQCNATVFKKYSWVKCGEEDFVLN